MLHKLREGRNNDAQCQLFRGSKRIRLNSSFSNARLALWVVMVWRAICVRIYSRQRQRIRCIRNRTTFQVSLAFPIVFTAFFGSQLAWATKYEIRFIDVPGALNTRVSGISDHGKVVGQYDNQHGFLFEDGVFTTIDYPGATTTDIRGISGSGLMVGTSDNDGGFRLSGSMFTQIAFPEITLATPADINDLGAVVGFYPGGLFGAFRAFVSDGPSFLTFDLSDRNRDTRALGINNSGQIIGDLGTGTDVGFVKNDDDIALIAVPGANYTAAFDINNLGDIVGRFGLPEGGSRSFVLSQGIYTTLDIPVGCDAVAINISGQIAGTCDDVSGRQRGFVATPVNEPTNFLLIVFGVSVLLLDLQRSDLNNCRRRKRLPLWSRRLQN